MRRLRKLWQRFQEDPSFTRKITGWLIIISGVEWVVATVLGWVQSVEYVSHLSQLAITISLIPWYQGTRVEARQAEEDIPNEVVEKIVERTEVDPA